MSLVLKSLSRIGLLLTAAPCFLHLFDALSLPNTKLLMVIGMILWFATAPIIQKERHAFAHHEDQDNI